MSRNIEEQEGTQEQESANEDELPDYDISEPCVTDAEDVKRMMSEE